MNQQQARETPCETPPCLAYAPAEAIRAANASAEVNGYRSLIEKAAPGSKPRQIEALMRDKFGALDALSPNEFEFEAKFAAFVIGKGMDLAEQLADAMGLPQ